MNYLRDLIIDDAYEERGSEDVMKPPYYFVDYNDRYGKYKFDNEKYQSIADKNAKYVAVIAENLKTMGFMSPKRVVYVAYKEGDKQKTSPNSLNDPANMCSTRMKSTVYIDINTDAESNKIVYTNRVNCMLIALLNMGYEVVFLPSVKSISHVDKLMLEKSKNPDFELIFCNSFNYKVDMIRIVEDTPIYFKKGRVLMHLLNLLTSRGEFKATFERIFKSSLLFIHSIRVGLFKEAALKEATAVNLSQEIGFPVKSLAKAEASPNKLLPNSGKSNLRAKSAPTVPNRSNKISKKSYKARSAPTVTNLNMTNGPSDASGPDDISFSPMQNISPRTVLKNTFTKIKLAHLRGQHEKDSQMVAK